MNNLEIMLNRVQVLIDLGTYANVATVQQVASNLNSLWDNIPGIDNDILTAELLQLSVYADGLENANEYFAAVRIYGGIAKSAKIIKEICRDLKWNNK